jgi:hypothetical protein
VYVAAALATVPGTEHEGRVPVAPDPTESAHDGTR